MRRRDAVEAGVQEEFRHPLELRTEDLMRQEGLTEGARTGGRGWSSMRLRRARRELHADRRARAAHAPRMPPPMTGPRIYD